MKTDALIGYSGFVGSTLLKQKAFGALFRSTNIDQIGDRPYGQVICAGAPAQKWIANRDPAADRQKINGLIEHLSRIQCDSFVLISTVDVFKQPLGVDETIAVDEEGLHAYGANRYRLEQFVREHFPKALIVRLPGLVGPGLRKNVIYDLLNDNNLYAVESRGVFQFYPMVNLGYDIQTAQAAGLELVHLTAEPISVADIARQGFGRDLDNTLEGTPAHYDFRSVHAEVFGGRDGYQYSARDTLLAVRAYAQSEPPVIKVEGQ